MKPSTTIMTVVRLREMLGIMGQRDRFTYRVTKLAIKGVYNLSYNQCASLPWYSITSGTPAEIVAHLKRWHYPVPEGY